MRILHLTSRMGIGGAETHIYTLAYEQKMLGCEVFCASAGGETVRMLEDAGIEHTVLPLDRKDPEALVRSARGIMRLIREKSIDTVHAHSRIPAFLMRGLSRELKKHSVTLIVSAHMPFKTNTALRSLSYWGEGTVAVSRDIKGYLVREYKLQPDRIAVIKNGIDTKKFKVADAAQRKKAREELGIRAESYVICTASRSSESRSALALYMSKNAKELLSDGEVLLLLLSGEVGNERDMLGEIREAAQSSCRALGREAVIIVEGEADISKYLCAADVFAGVSRSALEAMSCGIPCVIAGNEGYGGIVCSESVRALEVSNFTGRGGELSFDRLAEDLREIKEKSKVLGELSRAYITDNLDAQHMAESVLAFYRSISDKKQKKRLLIVGHYGAGNLGDDASCRVLCRELSARYELCFVCKNKSKLSLECGARGVEREDIAGIIREAKRAECVIFGGGNLLQDDSSTRSILYYQSVYEIARKYCKKVAFFANGLGPLRSKYAEEISDAMLYGANYISMRERESTLEAYASDMLYKVWTGADIVYLAGAKKGEISVQPKVASGLFAYLADKRYMLVCPRIGADDSDTRAVCEYAREAAERGIYTVIVPLFAEQDRNICLEMHKQIPGSCVYLGKLDEYRLTELLSGAELCIGQRLHAGILSISAECPFVGYDRDFRIWANLSHARCGEYLASGGMCADDIARAAKKQTEAVSSGVYSRELVRLRALAREDLERLVLLIDR